MHSTLTARTLLSRLQKDLWLYLIPIWSVECLLRCNDHHKSGCTADTHLLETSGFTALDSAGNQPNSIKVGTLSVCLLCTERKFARLIFSALADLK